MRPIELRWSGILATVAVFTAAAVCVRLGLWQLDRRDQRLTRNAQVAERVERPPVSLERIPSDTAGLTFRRAALEGTYDHDRSVVLAGRSHAGTPGAHVYSPLLLGSGAVLVNRGWLPAPDAATVDLHAVRRSGRVRLEGILMPFPDVDLDRPVEGFRTTWFRLDQAALRAQYPYEVAPLYLLATSAPGTPDPRAAGGAAGPGAADAAGGAARPRGTGPALIRAEPPSLGAGPHLSYALQWFSFALVLVVGWAALALRRTDGRPAVAPPPDSERPTRNRPTGS